MDETYTNVPGKKGYISLEEAEAAMIALRQEDIEAFGMVIPECFPSTSAIEALNKIPAADVRPVKYGRWIELENPNYSPFDPTSREYDLLCSNCGATHYGKERNFCPNCGADMREVTP